MTLGLHEQRLDAASEAVRQCGARTVADLGCGDGDFVVRLASDARIERIVGIDVCLNSLQRLRARLETMDGIETTRVDLVHGSMIDGRNGVTGFDCAVLIESIEHIEPDTLSGLERTVFDRMSPATVVITTPNAEFNGLLGVPPNRFRHPGHRFEWDRPKFQRWARGVAGRNGYDVAFRDIGGRHPTLGGISQMAVFSTARDRLDRADSGD